ncbi:10949_t:CDS:2, partial [Dentiscutata erythropus]
TTRFFVPYYPYLINEAKNPINYDLSDEIIFRDFESKRLMMMKEFV